MNKQRKTCDGGRKPSVAIANEQLARTNIKVKLEFLRLTLSQIGPNKLGGRPPLLARQRVLDGLPGSVRQFNAWTSEGARAYGLDPGQLQFKGNAQITLKNLKLIDAVQAGIQAVKSLRDTPVESQKREETMSDLRRDLKVSRALLVIAEGEILRLKKDLVARESEVEANKRHLESAKEESARSRRFLEDRIRALEIAARKSDPVVSLVRNSRGADKEK